MSPGVIRVLVVDDHTVVRKGLCALLATEPDIDVVGEAGDGREAVARAADLRPDVVVMDLEMPGVSGVEAIRRLRADDPDARVVVLTSHSVDALLLPAVHAGALGYVLKSSRPDEVVRAIRMAAEGRTVLDPGVARRLLREVARDGSSTIHHEALTERERDVLRLVAHGLSNRMIGSRLGISDATVRTHVGRVLAKLGIESRTQAALYALRVGLVRLEDTDSG